MSGSLTSLPLPLIIKNRVRSHLHSILGGKGEEVSLMCQPLIIKDSVLAPNTLVYRCQSCHCGVSSHKNGSCNPLAVQKYILWLLCSSSILERIFHTHLVQMHPLAHFISYWVLWKCDYTLLLWIRGWHKRTPEQETSPSYNEFCSSDTMRHNALIKADSQYDMKLT